MTVNGVMAVILRYFTEFGSFLANYVKLRRCDKKCIPKNFRRYVIYK